jgi:propionyl-CoA synthetase
MMVLNAGVDRDHDEIVKEVILQMRNKIGPVAAFKTAVVVKRLPKTRSGKILRGTMQSIADKKDYKVPATIDDYSILDEIKESLGTIGYGSKA